MGKDPYVELSRTDRESVLDDVARKMGIPPMVVEKDYWVCQTLDALFSCEDIGEHLVFKGGTSLSKVYRLIDRFSEDIDLSFHRSYLGFDAEDTEPEKAPSNKERARRLQRLQSACETKIVEVLLPTIREHFAGLLGNEGNWDLEMDKADAQTVLFRYPQASASQDSYVPPTVKIELGARSDHWPSQQSPVTSYIGEILGQEIGIASVEALSAERTFWEKATILHAECHRKKGNKMPDRYARHYHDLARMAHSEVALNALLDHQLRNRVVEHKSIYFKSGWANYEFAKPGSFRLVPDEYRLEALEADHQKMEMMYFSESPNLDEVLETLKELEGKINNL